MNGRKKDAKVQGSSVLLLALLQKKDKCMEGNRQKTLCWNAYLFTQKSGSNGWFTAYKLFLTCLSVAEKNCSPSSWDLITYDHFYPQLTLIIMLWWDMKMLEWVSYNKLPKNRIAKAWICELAFMANWKLFTPRKYVIPVFFSFTI